MKKNLTKFRDVVIPLLNISIEVILICLPVIRAEAHRSVDKVVASGVKFIEAEQISKPSRLYLKGEWPTSVSSSPLAVLVGVGDPFGPDQEPTAFTTGSVINELAMIYKFHPTLSSIPKMISRGLPTLERYREGALYDFYPAIMSGGKRIHGTVGMMQSPIWNGFNNIPQDADTTSVAFAARIFAGHLADQPFVVPQETVKSFSTFRDVHRLAEYYDRAEGFNDTGAFLTWQYDENNPKMPRFYFANAEEGPRIPFNRNDVDCIVNLNVLRLLALDHQSASTTGRKQSCAMLAQVVEREQYQTCGIYYPNTYNFAFSAALTEQAGEECLKPQHIKMAKYLMATQQVDGGWMNTGNMYINDRVHATAFAVYALAQFGDVTDSEVQAALIRGADFLMLQEKKSKAGNSYWDGEVFFTATAVARSLVVWRSDSFTTGSVLLALSAVHESTGWQPYSNSRRKTVFATSKGFAGTVENLFRRLLT